MTNSGPATTDALIRSILGDRYVELSVERYELVEDVAGEGGCDVRARLVQGKESPSVVEISGHGVGFIDALYNAVVAHFSNEHPSLESIRFTAFTVRGDMDTTRSKGADAEGIVTLTVTNSERRDFEFTGSGRSVVAAAAGVVVEALEYFVNSERAFVSAYHALEDAKKRGRADLVSDYTRKLSTLVQVTSYSSVIERIKAEALVQS